MGSIDSLNRLPPSEAWAKPEAAAPPRRDSHDENPRRKKRAKRAEPEDEFEVDRYEHTPGDGSTGMP